MAKIKVLVVEDDKYLATAYEMKFKRVDFLVKVALSVKEAFKVLESFKPKVIVLDLIMPMKDGFEMLEDLKSPSSKYKDIPVIVASNLGQDINIKEALKLGASDYVVKSKSSLESLVNKIKQLGLQ